MTSASLSHHDPAMIEDLRNQLAESFAQRVFDAVPDICECIDFEVDACDSASGKKRFERASQMIYSQRRDLQLHTGTTVRRIFDEKLDRLLDGDMPAERLSLDTMSMLADARLDEEIAINHCGRRLKEQCEYELWGLTQRIMVLTGISQPSDNRNPVYPQIFAQALMEAIGTLETDPAVRLVVFKTFGPVLLDIVPAVYVSANTTLKARGIDIESTEYYGRPIPTPERNASPSPNPHEIALGAAIVNQELTSALQQILAKSTSSLPAYVEPPATGAGNPPMATTLQFPVIEGKGETAHAWKGDLRGLETKAGVEAVETAAPARTLHDARRTLKEKLSRNEQVVGDIITVMFDRLLTEPRLPAQLRDIVAKLQLPVLELALGDRSLLTQVHHPVRKLLDLIAEFGLTLGMGDDDVTKVRSVENIVDGLLRIHAEEPAAFKLAFEQLDRLFYHHEEAALQNDEKLRALERSEAAEFAGRQADREIALRLQNQTIPAAITSFIVTSWRDVLIHDYLNGGPTGEPWRLGLTTLDDIVKSLRQATDEDERKRLARNLPSFIELLLNTPDTADNQDVLTANFFAELQRAHELAAAGKWSDIGGARYTPTAAALDMASSVASPSAVLASLGLACGDWIETRDFAGTRRWRLNWLTSILGTCVFRHYESNTTRNMSCEELGQRLATGEVLRVRGLGLADDVLNDAFETVLRKARRDEAKLLSLVPSSATRSTARLDVRHQWGSTSKQLIARA